MENQIVLVVSAVGFMAVLGLVLSSALAFANRKLWVYEDPRIGEVEDMLPATNCGACGAAGCRPFAEALIKGEGQPSQCTVNSKDNIDDIADYLGVDAGDVEKRVARLACAGGSHVARMRSHYKGIDSCRAAAVLSGGPKACHWGCLGLGDCAEICDQDAIVLDRNGLPIVIEDRCTACGDCEEICPKGLFSIHEVSHRLWVACANQDKDEKAEEVCEVACTACERCTKDTPEGVITMVNNLAVVDYSNNALASRLATERCQTGAIVWLSDQGIAQKGAQAKKIIRKTALPVGTGASR
ncbi:MAG: RnfABCDGE type electron transport complex subunit B [Gammaproteobacteria bacterium]